MCAGQGSKVRSNGKNDTFRPTLELDSTHFDYFSATLKLINQLGSDFLGKFKLFQCVCLCFDVGLIRKVLRQHAHQDKCTFWAHFLHYYHWRPTPISQLLLSKLIKYLLIRSLGVINIIKSHIQTNLRQWIESLRVFDSILKVSLRSRR